MALNAEAAHEKGRKGVILTQRWLESTTHLELPADAYDFSPECRITCLDGSKKLFDLKGWFFKNKRTVWVENKAVSGERKQPQQYPLFLAIAYSATAMELKTGGLDPRWEFMWVTTHPFALPSWTKLTKPSQIRQALEGPGADLLNGERIDEDIIKLVSDRIWLLVLNTRQAELTLSASELSMVESVLKRKKKGKAK